MAISRKQVLEIYMILGGIPYYLEVHKCRKKKKKEKIGISICNICMPRKKGMM